MNYLRNTANLNPIKLKTNATAEPATPPILAHWLSDSPNIGAVKLTTPDAVPTLTKPATTETVKNLPNSSLFTPLLTAEKTQNLFHK